MSTWHQRIVLPFFCGSSTNSRTRPTTSGPVMSPPCRPSSSRPTRTRLAATSRPVATGREVAASLVRVGLEEEGLHGGDITGPLVVGRVLEFVEEPQKNGKTIRWCQVD